MTVVRSPEDLLHWATRGPGAAAYRVRRQGEGWLELEVAEQRTRGVPVFLVVVWPEVWGAPALLRPHLVRARAGNYPLIALQPEGAAVSAELEAQLTEAEVLTLPLPIALGHLERALRLRADACAQRMATAALELVVERARHENDMLITIGRALSQERDIKSLLMIILRRACEVTGADAGSIYTVEEPHDAGKRSLRFVVSHNDSRTVEEGGFTIPVSSRSIVGACVQASDIINIRDLYNLDAPGVGNNPWGFAHDRSFDDKYAYQTRSMIAVPMISARGDVIGVIQLINKRAKGWISLERADDFQVGVVPFDEISVAYVSTLASQAGLALENVLLYEEVKTLFDGFVKASVTAIESRDPTTSGHSERVAQLTVGLAKAVGRAGTGRYRETRFSRDDLTQIQYAALLHDFGKVGVREHILVKPKKLFDHQRDLILERFRVIRRGYQLEAADAKIRYLMEASREKVAAELAAIDHDVLARLRQVDEAILFILAANEPTVLDQGGFERIAEIAGMTYRTDDGQEEPVLSCEEASALQIRRGSLTDAERLEINRHVVHTYNFLCEIPWGRALRDVPHIAGAHHEKLDGTGYPNGLRGQDIPVPARMMTIADIYDALTASDRPYKRALPAAKALDILADDVKKGSLDAELFAIFTQAQVWSLVSK
ncbi:MAG: HD domain-containing phosphohydrolase [Kofleriaceae bacterium]